VSFQAHEAFYTKKSGRSRNIAAGVPWALALAILPVLLLRAGNGDYLAKGDNFVDLHPYITFLFDQLLKGNDPAWNPYLCGGMPMAGYGNVSIYYPLYWIHTILDRAPAFNVTMMSSYFLASLGIFLFARSWDISRPSAFLSATSYAYGAYMLGWLDSLEAVEPAMWLGWLLLCLEELRRSGDNSRRAAFYSVAAAFVSGVMAVAGHPQITLYAGTTAAVYVIYFISRRKAPRAYPAWSALAAALGFMLAAPHLLPGIILSAQSWRSELDYGRFVSPTLFPSQFLGGMFFVNAQPSLYFSAYLGIAPVLLMFRALGRRRAHPLVPLSAGIMIGAILLALGRSDGIDRVMFHVPIYRLFSFHSRHTMEMSFFGALLAGLGLDELMESRRGPLSGAKEFSALLLALLASLFLLWLSEFKPDTRLLLAPAVATPAIVLIHLASVRAKRSSLRSFLIAATAVILLIEPYFTVIRRGEPYNSARNAERESVTSRLLKRLEKDHNPPDRLFSMVNIGRGNWMSIHDACQSNLGTVAEVAGAGCYNPSMLRRFKEIMALDYEGWPVSARTYFNPSNRAPDLLAARYVSYAPRYVEPYYIGDTLMRRREVVSGIEFAEPLLLRLEAGESLKIWMPDFLMDAVGVVSEIGGVSGVVQGQEVASLKFTDGAGATREVAIRAGEHTALFNHEALLGMLPAQTSFLGAPFYGLKTWYLKSGESASVTRSPFRTKSVALLTYLVHSDGAGAGEEAGRIELMSPEGDREIVTLRVGKNTGDWAMEDRLRKFNYNSPPVFRNVTPMEGMNFKGRDYPVLIELRRPMTVARALIENTMKDGVALVVEDVTLMGEEGGAFAPLYHPGPPLHSRPPYFPAPSVLPPGYHEYVARIALGEKMAPRSLTIKCLLPEGFIQVSHLTLINSAEKSFYPLGLLDTVLDDARRFRPLLRREDVAVVENMNALPRAWLAVEALVMPFEQIGRTIRNNALPDGKEFDPLRVTLLERPPQPPPQITAPSPAASEDNISFITYTPNSFSISVSCVSPRWLVLSEIYYPGWEAELDGRTWPVEPAYGMLRAIMTPAGRHKVVMYFRPPLLRWGRILALAGLAFIVIITVFFIVLPGGKTGVAGNG